MPQPDPTQHLVDYEYISQFATDIVGLSIYVNGVAGDPDSELVYVTMTDQNSNVIFSNQPAQRSGVGAYYYQLTSADTSTPAYYTFTWTFNIASVPQTMDTYAQVGGNSPAYDALSGEMKGIVELTWIRFADQFDSPQGGPYLQTLFQTAFSRNRLAQLLLIALNRLNTVSQPYQSYTLANFPVTYWGGLLERSLFVETLKHLKRSYIEMPTPQGVNVSINQRRDYADRYDSILRDEEGDLKLQLETFKISQMGLGVPTVLLSGGAYGNFSRARLPISAAARGHFWQRNF